jgi:methyl-accepting chemotaxis protein
LKWTFSLSIRAKLIGGFCAVLVLLVGMGGMSLTRMDTMGKSAETIRDRHLPSIVALGQLNEDLANVENQVLSIVMDNDAGRRDTYVPLLNQMLKDLDSHLADFTKGLDEENRPLFDYFSKSWTEYVKGIPTMIKDSSGADATTRNKIITDARPLVIQSKDTIHNMVKKEQEKATETTSESVQSYDSARRVILLFSILAVVLGALVSVYCLFSILPPVRRLGESVRRVAEGELSAKPLIHTRRDEIGKLVDHFNRMTASLRTMIRQTQESALEVAATADVLLASADQTRQSSELITGSIEQVAGDLERQAGISTEAKHAADEIAKGMEQIAGSVSEVTDSSSQVVEQVTQGNQVVQQTVRHMHGVDEKVQAIAGVVSELEAGMKQIEGSVQAITNITRQTNILALNAGIEASRAGEQGKAFIVLAAEIRKLAEQSQAFTGQISESVEQISILTRRAVTSTQDGSEAVQQGLHVVEEAGHAFTAIARAIEGVASQTQEMSAVVQQVNAGTQMMAGSFAKIEEAALTSASTSQTVAAAAEEQNSSVTEINEAAKALAQMSQQLRDSIASFKLE